MKRTVVVMAAVFLVVTSLNGCRPKQEAKAEIAGLYVRTGYARTGSMNSTVSVSGDIKALKSVALSARISGHVVSVPYRESDYVPAGATVVQQDISDLNTQVRQAEAALQAARARLSQAATSAGVSDTQTEAGVAQAEAGLDAARANLRMLQKGARSQEIASAESGVTQAQATFDNAQVNLKRTRDLYAQGALSRQQMDLVQMQYDIAKAQLESARQQSSLVKAGAREEQIEAAEKQVRQAEEGLRIAKSNRSQKDLRREDVKSARAGVDQAEAALAYAKQQLANAYIRTPISGSVAKRMTEPGQMASPGIPLMEIVALDTVYFEANVSEIDLGKVRVGQSVSVSVDALPGNRFTGTVAKIYPTADPSTRQFGLRIQVTNRGGELRPGMFARGLIEVARHSNTVIIPKDAVLSNGEGKEVYVIVGDKALLRPITTGFETREEIEVLSGVSSGERLITVGQDKLSDGVKVNAAD